MTLITINLSTNDEDIPYQLMWVKSLILNLGIGFMIFYVLEVHSGNCFFHIQLRGLDSDDKFFVKYLTTNVFLKNKNNCS